MPILDVYKEIAQDYMDNFVCIECDNELKCKYLIIRKGINES